MPSSPPPHQFSLVPPSLALCEIDNSSLLCCALQKLSNLCFRNLVWSVQIISALHSCLLLLVYFIPTHPSTLCPLSSYPTQLDHDLHLLHLPQLDVFLTWLFGA